MVYLRLETLKIHKLYQDYDYNEISMDLLHYHEFGILSIGREWMDYMRILEIVGDSDEITISNFVAAE